MVVKSCDDKFLSICDVKIFMNFLILFLCGDCFSLETIYIDCFGLLHEYMAIYMGLLSYAVTVRHQFIYAALTS